MKKLLWGGVALIALVGSQLVLPVEYTFATRLGQMLGAFEAQWIEARTEAKAIQTEELREAEEKVYRRNKANDKALEIESYIATKQIEKTNNSTWIKEILANASDAGCALYLLAGTNSPEEERDAQTMCAAGEMLRTSIAEDFGKAIDGERTDAMREMIERFRAAEEEMAR